MAQHISLVALVVPDYDAAIAFYCNVLGFSLIEDTKQSPTKRWVVVAPSGAGSTRILLAKADGPEQEAAIGNQTGGRVGFFLQTDDFDADFARMKDAGVTFLEEPRDEPYAKVVVWRDPFGNTWDLLQPR
ncbi:MULTISPECIES: VOC family protein [Halocynthiibacter]|uniref:VOC family protein n=1 Tax=Halocynthiibacter halioticoli TaxID=2986804 RepID=A0AAE3LSZ3_9RHOB|nr:MULTISPECIES: VOC family protein [Halocynthiibacter]MCV6824201.1 VOC family protein [Halocynthiibacter halioticoli]MCW4057202.1 VOC family protein [Halocynthiibacter sp. SDUM655004]